MFLNLGRLECKSGPLDNYPKLPQFSYIKKKLYYIQ